MKFITDYRLEDFIVNSSYEALPDSVKKRLHGCLIDLFGALLSGTKSEQFRVGVTLAKKLYGSGDIAVIGANEKFNFYGASAAMGHSSNAYDIDDGHNLIRAHPGTSFIGALLAKAYELDASLKDLLISMLVAYEGSIRMGAAIMDYYNYAHSSGTFGAVGVVIGVGKLLGLSRERINNALSVAEFNAPLVPGIRSVEYPSMNKDGVPFGVMIGTLALAASESGFLGNKHLLEAEEYRHYLDDLGKVYEVENLYFKPYPCCRWAHPAIDAVTETMRENNLGYDMIERVVIKTFKRATLLSKIEPKNADEAQYNIAYPVASAIVYGDFGIDRVMKDAFSDRAVLDMMKRLSFEVDEKIDSAFPKRRICRAEIYTKDGGVFVSADCEPRGEASENIDIPWLVDKFYRISAPVISREAAEAIVALISGDENISVRKIVDFTNEAVKEKV